MTMRLVVVVAALLAGAPRDAAAIDRDCPRGEVWDANQGSCMKKVKVDRRSPAQKYYDAIEQLEGTVKKARPERGVALLRDACSARHAPACTLLGFLYRSGRTVEADARQSIHYYDLACRLDDPNGCLGAAEVHARARNHDKAIPSLQAACKLDSGRGCWELAEKHYYALGVVADAARAKALYVQAVGLLRTDCARKNAPACYALGLAHANGKGTTESATEAFKAFLAGCEAGSGDACNQVGTSYNGGDGVDQSVAQAQKYWELACRKYDSAIACHDAGLTIAQAAEASTRTAEQNKDLMQLAERACTLDRQHCDLIGYLYGTGRGGINDEDQAARWYQVGCDNGSAASCSSVAFRSFKGIGMKKDTGQAMVFWEKACDLKWASACTELGNRFYEGEIVDKDLPKAYEWFSLGCLRDDASGCHSVAWAWQHGETPGAQKDAKKALQYYNKACDEQRLSGACVDKGRFLEEGAEGVEADPDAAVAAFDLACELGHDKGCMDLGDLHFHGQKLPKDELKAGQAYLRACKLGHEQACGWIDGLFKSARANVTQKAKAMEALEAACGEDKDAACLALGAIYAWGGYIGGKNGRRAFALYGDACKRGVKQACLQLGHCYINGIGVVADPDQGKQLFTEQCNGDVPAACAWLGMRLHEEKKFDQAGPLFRRACDDKDPVGCTMIGYAHYTRQGASWDVPQARKDWEGGCQLGETVSCHNLGMLYAHGIGVDVDAKKAAEFFQKACTPGSASACGELGGMYERGQGVSKDVERAEAEYARACDEGEDGTACRALGDLLARGGKARPARIAGLYQKAFELVSEVAERTPYGKYKLGVLHRDGVAVVKNPTKAAELFALSCDGYDPLGCMAAGQMYMGDQGIPADREAAAVRFERACAAGVDAGCAGVKQARGVGPGQIKKRGACACDGSRDPGALVLVLAVAALAIRRRRPA